MKAGFMGWVVGKRSSRRTSRAIVSSIAAACAKTRTMLSVYLGEDKLRVMAMAKAREDRDNC